ncbi:hypothetical protein N9808_01400 [Hyphomicrobiales bacterium]|nr:hypothetical protein [Hyphomicrobiales bacterium]
MKKANKEIVSLYLDKVIRNGKIVIKFTKLAPAPRTINNAGKAQHINVDEEANKVRKFKALSFILFITLLF